MIIQQFVINTMIVVNLLITSFESFCFCKMTALLYYIL